MKFKSTYLLLICLLCIAFTASAQEGYDDYGEESEQSFYTVQENEGLSEYSDYTLNPIVVNELDDARWKKLQEELNYPRGFKEIEEDKEKEVKPRDSSNDAAWASLFKVILIILAILVVAFVLFKFLEGDTLLAPRNRRIKDVNFNLGLDEIEANIHDLELQDYIQNALKNEDHRLAIRLYYLDIIKGLSNAKLIKWKRDKTNGEYVSELTGNELHGSFQEVTLYFERVWYGNTEVSKKDFEQLSPYFKSFLAEINN